jgi:hypothetical protein
VLQWERALSRSDQIYGRWLRTSLTGGAAWTALRVMAPLRSKFFDVIHHIFPGAYAGSRKNSTLSVHRITICPSWRTLQLAIVHYSPAALMTRLGF